MRIVYLVFLISVIILSGCSRTANNYETIQEEIIETPKVEIKTTDEINQFNPDRLFIPETEEVIPDVELREPLQKIITNIPETLPDTYHEESGYVIDNNLTEQELPEPLMFLYNFNIYLYRELLNSGYLMIYSYRSGIDRGNTEVSIETLLQRLRINNESLDFKGETLMQLYSTDTNLIRAWRNLHHQLNRARLVLNKINEVSEIEKYNQEIDINRLFNYYRVFKNETTKHLTGFIPVIQNKGWRDDYQTQ